MSPLPPRVYLSRAAVVAAVGGRYALEQAERLGALVRLHGVAGLKRARYERYWVQRYLDAASGVLPMAQHLEEIRAAHAQRRRA